MINRSFLGTTLIVLFLLISFSTKGQILLTDRNTIKDDTSRVFRGAFVFSFDLKNRSTSRDSESIYKGVDFSADLLYLGEDHAFLMINLLDYYSVTGGKILNTGYSHVRVVVNRRNTVSPELYAQGQYDVGRNLNQRFLGGMGARISFIHDEGTDFYMGSGFMYEFEEWSFEDYSDQKRLIKNNTYIGYQTKINENLNFHLINYYQVGKDGNIWRNRLSGDVWFSVAITKKVDLLARFSYQYESRPVVPINKFIYSYNNGLKIRF